MLEPKLKLDSIASPFTIQHIARTHRTDHTSLHLQYSCRPPLPQGNLVSPSVLLRFIRRKPSLIQFQPLIRQLMSKERGYITSDQNYKLRWECVSQRARADGEREERRGGGERAHTRLKPPEPRREDGVRITVVKHLHDRKEGGEDPGCKHVAEK